jgi:hypothetical protein
MPMLLHGVTFSASARKVEEAVWPTPIPLKPYQILVWVSLAHPGIEHLPPETPRLPALLDTGHNHNLSLREEHLQHCALSPPLPWSSVPLQVRDASGAEWAIPRLLVDVWLHSNLPELADRPYPLRLGFRGVTCYPASGPVKGPHLPLLGLAALCAGSLTVEVRCTLAGGILNVTAPE